MNYDNGVSVVDMIMMRIKTNMTMMPIYMTTMTKGSGQNQGLSRLWPFFGRGESMNNLPSSQLWWRWRQIWQWWRWQEAVVRIRAGPLSQVLMAPPPALALIILWWQGWQWQNDDDKTTVTTKNDHDLIRFCSQ